MPFKDVVFIRFSRTFFYNLLSRTLFLIDFQGLFYNLLSRTLFLIDFQERLFIIYFQGRLENIFEDAFQSIFSNKLYRQGFQECFSEYISVQDFK